MTNIGSTSVQPRLLPIALTIMAMIVVMGCGRSEDSEIQAAPAFPDLTSDSDPGDVDDAVETITQSLPTCSQLWDAQNLFQMVASSYYYGGYQPFMPNQNYGSNFLQNRGFMGAGGGGGGQLQAMTCANDLMGAASFLQSQANHYGPGSIQTWLGGMVGWAYGGGGSFGSGYAGGQWGGYNPAAWGNSPWTQ